MASFEVTTEDHGDTFPKFGGVDGSFLARGAASDHNQVIVLIHD